MAKKIICRADGNSEIGLGHIYRMLAIAEFYSENYELIFVTREDSTEGIIPNKFKTIAIPKVITIKEEPEWLLSNFLPSEYIIIVDGYQFISLYQKEIKNKGYKLIYIDDLATEYMYADVVVNHSPYFTRSHFKSEAYTQFALGTSYAMLRPLFNKLAKQKREITSIRNAFICFGGADTIDLSLKATKALLNIENIDNINIILGGAYGHEEIFDLKEKHSDKINIYRNLSEEKLLNTMQQCNFAIAPASTILYELCSVKMPVLSGYYIDNQIYIYTALKEKGVIFGGGDFRNYTVSDFEIKIKELLTKNLIDTYLENQHKLFNGKSKIHFLNLINGLNITFRKANEKDISLVYNWSNDELVRENSYNKNKILFENHKNWYSNKLNDENTLFLIALVNDKPAGIVRYDVDINFAVIGILISKEFRGQKLASKFLKESATLYFNKFSVPVLAYIKKENKASSRSFKNANYTHFKDENIQGSISEVYKLEERDVGA